jgi:hypothetical protein
MHSSNTCDMYMCRLRHINVSVLSSLKMEGIRKLFLSEVNKAAEFRRGLLSGGNKMNCLAWISIVTFVGRQCNVCSMTVFVQERRFCTWRSEVNKKGKGKGHLRTGHEGPEGEQRHSFTLSLTSALDGGGWSTPRPGRFTPGKVLVPIVQETVDPRAGLNRYGKSRPHRDSISGPSSP